MNKQVLVLNQDYNPIYVCSVERAFILVLLNKVELIEKYSGFNLRTVSRTYDAPAVIRLQRYINLPFKSVSLSRVNVFKRDGMSCQYCGAKSNLTLDHVIPRSKGGKSSWKNLVTACRTCNSRKGDNEPHEVGMRLRSMPFKPAYIIFLRDFSGNICDEWKPYLSYGSAKIAM